MSDLPATTLYSKKILTCYTSEHRSTSDKMTEYKKHDVAQNSNIFIDGRSVDLFDIEIFLLL